MLKETRKKIAMIGAFLLVFVASWTMIAQVEIPSTTSIIITAFIGWIGYYFGKSTAQDHSKDYNNLDPKDAIGFSTEISNTPK